MPPGGRAHPSAAVRHGRERSSLARGRYWKRRPAGTRSAGGRTAVTIAPDGTGRRPRPPALPALRRRPVPWPAASVRCASGHSFDVARQGYVNLAPPGGSPLRGDSAAMVAAREAFLATGHFDADRARRRPTRSGPPRPPSTAAWSTSARAPATTSPRCSTGSRAGPGSPSTARTSRCAAPLGRTRGSPRSPATRGATLPLRDATAAVVLSVFAPRGGGGDRAGARARRRARARRADHAPSGRARRAARAAARRRAQGGAHRRARRRQLERGAARRDRVRDRSSTGAPCARSRAWGRAPITSPTTALDERLAALRRAGRGHRVGDRVGPPAAMSEAQATEPAWAAHARGRAPRAPAVAAQQADDGGGRDEHADGGGGDRQPRVGQRSRRTPPNRKPTP